MDDKVFEVDHGSVAVWKGVCSSPDPDHDEQPFIVLSAIAVKHSDNPEDPDKGAEEYRIEMTLSSERAQEFLAQLTEALTP